MQNRRTRGLGTRNQIVAVMAISKNYDWIYYFMKIRIKKKVVGLIVFMLISLLVGCGKKESTGDDTIKSEGMSIVLGKQYQEAVLANATWYYTSPDGLAMGIRSKKDDIEKSGLEANSAQDYAEAYIKANSIPGSPKVKTKGKYVYFEYSRKVKGTDYSYLSCVYDNKDEFWLVNFACYKELYKEYKSDFFASADSVTFEE